MGSKSPQTTTTVNTPPPQVLAQYQKVTDQANQVAQTPYQSYNGELVAGMNGQQGLGVSGINNYANSAQGGLGAAAGLTLAGAGQANAQQFSADALSQYLSPYQQQVISATQAQMANQDTQQAQQLQGNIISSGAFGGDRAGVAQAQLAGQQAIANNSTLANLNNQNYSQALGEFNTQQATNLSADQANLARLSSAGAQIGGLSTAAQTAGLQGAAAQLQAGTLQQQTQQAQDTAAYNQFLQQEAYPFQTTQWLANISEGIGSNSGGTSTSSSSAPNSLNGIVGAGALGLGAYNSGMFSGIGSALTSGLGGLFALSDRRAKEDVQPIGETYDGQTIHRFRYRGDPETRLGLIAQEVERDHPGAVRREPGLGGLRMVDYRAATDDAAERKHFDAGGLVLPYASADANVQTWVPQTGGLTIGHGMGIPTSHPAASNQNGGLNLPQLMQTAGLTGKKGVSSNPVNQQTLGLIGATPDWSIGDVTPDTTGLVNGSLYARGGPVRKGFDLGGDVTPDMLAYDPSALGLGSPEIAALVQKQQQDQAARSTSSGLTLPAGSQVAFNGPVSDAPAPGLTVAPAQGGGAQPGTDLGDAGYIGPDGKPRPYTVGPGSVNAAPGLVALTPAASPSAPPPASAGLGAIRGAILGQESGNRDNVGVSVDGARGPGQIMPGTFAQYAKPGESIDNPDDNRAVNARILADYSQRYGGDPARIAVAYFSGPGNVAPPGSPTPFIKDKADGNGTLTSQYVASVLGRIPGVGDNSALAYEDKAPGLSYAPAQQAIGAATQPQAGLTLPPEHVGLLGLSDAAGQGLMAAGLAMMASPSRNLGMAIGQGGLAGLGAYQKAVDQERQNANTQSEIATRRGQLGVSQQEVGLKAKDLELRLEQIKRSIAAGAIMAGGAGPVPSAQTGVPPVAASAPSGAIPAQRTIPGSVAPAPAASPAPASTGAPQRPQMSQGQSGDFWSDVPAMENPVELYRRGQAMAALDPALSTQMMTKAQAIIDRGTVFKGGQLVPIPGFVDAKAATAGAEAGARGAAESQYRFREVQPTPGGPTQLVRESDIPAGMAQNPTASTVGTGAGSPPGAAINQAAAANPLIAKQPEFYAERQKQIATGENEMMQQFQARQLSKQRLQALQGIMQTYQPGAFAEEKADLVANLRAAGFNVKNSDTANPAAFQEFIKNATANVFNDVKGMGGKVLVSEIQGLTKANANPELQPAAAAAIIGQGLGIINYEDQHTRDYFNWKKQNPNAYDTSSFELPWTEAHPVSDYTKAATNSFGYKGQEVPAAAQREAGKVYMTPKGPLVWRDGKWFKQ